jgi:ADP-ribose pyrophosphatase YjhB (NUDIX family)
MPRRYEVFIEGLPLVLADSDSDTTLYRGLSPIRIHNARDLAEVLAALRSGARKTGVLAFGPGAEQLWAWLQASHAAVRAAGGAVVDEHGRLLAIRRLGKWDLPKGKVDKGEGIEAAALREVREECGLHELRIITVLPITWHTYERKGLQHLKRTDWYMMQGTAKEALSPQLEEDITEVRWMTAAEVVAMKSETYPSLLPVIAAWEQWYSAASHPPAPPTP